MQEKEINDLIFRITSGKYSAADERSFLEWFQNNEENIEDFAAREKLWTSIDIILNHKRYNYRTAYDKFRSGLLHRKKISGPVNTRKLIAATFRWAAVAIIFMSFGSLLFYFISKNAGTIPGQIEVIAPIGSRSNIILSDSTSVWLNAGSKLSYPVNFGEFDRTVNLEGEAFFVVHQSTKHPFTVMTSQLEMIALGTSFNVKSYPGEDIIQTTLVSGSLKINRSNYRSKEAGLILEPNQQITYYKKSGELLSEEKVHDAFEDPGPGHVVKRERDTETGLPKIILSRGIDPEIFTSWKENKLIFDDEPFESIAVKLERRFGARLIIKDDEIRNKRFKGRFEEVTMEQALSALRYVSPFNYHIQNDTIFITR